MTAAASPKKTLTAWSKAKRHTVALPSGYEIEVEIPNLPQLVKTGYLSNELVSEALSALQTQKLTPEVIINQAEFYDKLIAITVKEPAVTEEEVKDLPFEDVELIVEIATRQRDLDALGRHIGGLHTQAEFRKFRGLNYGDADLEGV